MADLKISQLTAITTLTPATDVLPVVDVTGTTKKITTNQILGSGGTATLASATITGNLTVRTNALTVDANNNVGIGTTAPTVYANYRTLAIVGGSTGGVLDINPSGGVTAGGMQIASTATGTTISSTGPSAGTAAPFIINTGTYGATSERYRIAGDGVATWSNVGGTSGTAMTLNSTGLGVGEAASVSRLQPRGSTSDSSAYVIYAKNSGGSVINFMRNDGRFIVGNGTTDNLIVTETGNVGIGVTPSAWVASYKGLQLKESYAGLFADTSNGVSELVSNAYNDGAWKFANAGNGAARYRMDALNRTHAWFYAATSANPITWTQAMTLDASGRLLVGTANASVTSETGCRLLLNNGAVGHFTMAITTNQSTAATSCYDFYSTSAAAYRFYVTSAGVINATNTTISAISDARLKENVQDIDVGLGAILALKPRKFDWKAGKGKDIKGDRGFIAQEFETVFPNLIDEWKDPAPEGEAPYKSVRQDLIPVLVKAIQELAAEVNALKKA